MKRARREKRVKILTSFMIVLTGIVFGNVFAKDVTNADLLKLFKSRIEVFSKCDTVELRNICTKDYQCINSAGLKMNLEEIKQYIVDQKKQIRAYEILTFQPFAAQDESMAFVVSEIEEEIVQDKTIIKNSLIVTEIYRKVNKIWKIQLTQISEKICNYP
jgi:hypothetical protein